MAVSLPGGIPGEMGSRMPLTPVSAMRFREGLVAVSRGVLLFSSLIGRSAMPSPMIRIVFKL